MFSAAVEYVEKTNIIPSPMSTRVLQIKIARKCGLII